MADDVYCKGDESAQKEKETQDFQNSHGRLLDHHDEQRPRKRSRNRKRAIYGTITSWIMGWEMNARTAHEDAQDRRILYIGIVLCRFTAPILRPCNGGTCSWWNAFHNYFDQASTSGGTRFLQGGCPLLGSDCPMSAMKAIRGRAAFLFAGSTATCSYTDYGSPGLFRSTTATAAPPSLHTRMPSPLMKDYAQEYGTYVPNVPVRVVKPPVSRHPRAFDGSVRALCLESDVPEAPAADAAALD